MKVRSAPLPRRLSALLVASLARRRRPSSARAPRLLPRHRRRASSKVTAPVSNEVIKIKLPRAQEAQLSNGAYLMVLEDHRVPSVQFEIIMIGAGGYYDPAGHARPRRYDRVADGRGHDDEDVRADRAGARHHGGARGGVGERGIADRDASPARR